MALLMPLLDGAPNAEMTKSHPRVMHKPLWLPSVPAIALQVILGEMADIVLKGSKYLRKNKRTGFVTNSTILMMHEFFYTC